MVGVPCGWRVRVSQGLRKQERGGREEEHAERKNGKGSVHSMTQRISFGGHDFSSPTNKQIICHCATLQCFFTSMNPAGRGKLLRDRITFVWHYISTLVSARQLGLWFILAL